MEPGRLAGEPPASAAGPEETPEKESGDSARGKSGYGYGYGYGYGGSGRVLRPDRLIEASQVLAQVHRYELILRRHWWIALVSLVVALGPVSFHTYTTPPSYSSDAKMWLSGKLNLREGQMYSEEVSSFIGTQVEVLKSRTVFDRALGAVLKDRPDSAAFLSRTNDPGHPPIVLEVKDFPKTAVIELRAVGPDAQTTRAFLDALMEEYATFRKEDRMLRTDTTLASVAKQVDDLQKDLKRQQDGLQDFQASNNVVMLQEQGNSAGAFVARLTRQLAVLRTEYNLLQLLTPEQLTQNSARTQPISPDDKPFGDDSARDLAISLAGPNANFLKASQEIQLLKAKRLELSEFLRPNHPKILKLEQDIGSQEQIVEVARQQSSTQMQNRRQALELQMRSLEDAIKEWETKALDTSKKMAEYERLRQEAQRTQAMYERLLTLVQSVDVNKTLDQESIRVMEKASIPKPVRKTMKLLVLGVAAGFALGFGIVYLFALFDDRFSSISELRTHLAEIVLGLVPEVRIKKGDPQSLLLAPDDVRHSFAESLRNLRSSVLYMLSDKKERKDRPRVLMVTSSVPSEGKTTISANLAAALAFAGSKVLLIDGDLRRASLHDLLGGENVPGMAEVLSQDVHYPDAVHSTKLPNLSFMPAGEARTNPGELFLSPSADVFLSKVRTQYDYVVIDSAPVLATDDTTSLAPRIDGVLFVVRADYTSARAAREAIQLLRQRGVTVYGIVFNRAVSSRADGGYYYYRYNNYYDYYYTGRKGKEGERGYGRRRKSAAAPPAAPADATVQKSPDQG